MKISVIGEVARPGQYDITNDRISLLDALSLAGDLTIYGVRSDVKVIREENGVRTTASLDLTSQDIYDSPYFYLQQNDVIYVKPNKYRAQAGEISQNRSFYISLLSRPISARCSSILTASRYCNSFFASIIFPPQNSSPAFSQIGRASCRERV